MNSLGKLFFGDGQSFPPSLSKEERRRGRLLFYRFYTLNGISVACLMHNILVLYAIRSGLSDSMVAVMASFIHLTMPFLLLGKPAIARIGAARTRALGWFFRYVSASIMILAPFAANFASQTVVTAIILTGAFGFAAFRSIGTAAITPLQGEVAESKKPGSFVAMTQIRQQTTYFITMATVIAVFWYVEELWVYQLVLGLGCAVGLYASTITLRIPESHAPLQSARKSFREMLRKSWVEKNYRRLMFAWSAGVSSCTIVIPFMMITVKNGYGVSDFAALIFALTLVLGGISSGHLSRRILDVVGARLLMTLYVIGLMGTAVFWSFAPINFIPVAVGAIFFLAGFCEIGIRVAIGQHFLAVVTDKDRVGSSMLMRIASGAAGGLAGSVVGGGLLTLLASMGFEGFDVYRRYFMIILAILFIFLIVVSRIEGKKQIQN